MKKISIVSEKNEENNAYEIRTIVIFDDNKAPEIINYDGVQDLISIVEFAEKNGFDILGNDGIKPALENGLIQVISSANKKAMAELKAEIVKEQLAYAPEKELTEEEKMENAINEQLNELKEKKEEKEEELVDGKITAETSVFKPLENTEVSIPDELEELSEYFTLDVPRSKRQLPRKGLLRIEELKSKNEKIAELEQLKGNINILQNSYDMLENKEQEEAKKLLTELNEKIRLYNDLCSQYKQEISDATKKAIEEKNKTVLTKNKLDLSIEDREYAEYLRLNILRAKNKLSPDELSRIKELRSINEKVAGLEQGRDNVISAMNRYNSFEDKTSAEALLAERDIKDRQKEYDAIQARYRAEFAETVKNARVVEVEKINEAEERMNREEQPQVTETQTEIVEPVEDNREVVEETADDILAKNEAPVETVENEEKDDAVNLVETPAEVEQTEEKIEDQPQTIETPVQEDVNEENKIEEPAVQPHIIPVETTGNKTEEDSKEKKPKYKIVKDEKEKKAEGINPVTEEEKDVDYKDEEGNNHTIKVRKTSKLKEWLKRIGAFVLGVASGIGAFTGISALINKNKNNNNVVPPVVVETPAPEQVDNKYTLVVNTLNNYIREYNVPRNTIVFFQQREVLDFLTNYKNEAQLKEVISALAYGYEANILATKDGNFRLDEDGNNYLTSFTRDFLCAKAVVNGYTPKDMLALFGGQQITYESLMNGFKNYCYTVNVYGMNATEGLPFRYLTNNNPTSTKVLNEIQDKLLEVNRNIKNDTLNSTITDDFIAKVFEVFVLNDESLNLTTGEKTVAAQLVSSFVAINANIAYGEPLYLHEDHGYAKAGINLKEVDGRFTFTTADKESYEFTSLYDVMNHGYGDREKTDARCLDEQTELMSKLNIMQSLSSSNKDVARLNLATALYQNGLKLHADRISAGSQSEALLEDILTINPMLEDEVEAYRSALRNESVAFVDFDTTVEGVDRLLGIYGRNKNNYADLINNRRNKVSLSNNFTVVNGMTYEQMNKNGYLGGYTGGYSYGYENDEPDKRIISQTTTEKHEKIKEEDMTEKERQEAKEQIHKIEQQEQQEHEEKIDNAKEELREGVKEGKTQEELEQVAEDSGITLDPNYQQNMQEALEEQRRGEEERLRQEEEIRRRNEEAERAAREEAERVARQQEEELRRQQELIEQSMQIDQEIGESQENNQNHDSNNNVEDEDPSYQGPDTDFDQADEGRIDENAGEEEYIPTSASVKEELNALRQAALAMDVKAEDLGIEESGPKLA